MYIDKEQTEEMVLYPRNNISVTIKTSGIFRYRKLSRKTIISDLLSTCFLFTYLLDNTGGLQGFRDYYVILCGIFYLKTDRHIHVGTNINSLWNTLYENRTHIRLLQVLLNKRLLIKVRGVSYNITTKEVINQKYSQKNIFNYICWKYKLRNKKFRFRL